VIFTAIRYALLLLALAPIGYYLVAIVAGAAFFRRRGRAVDLPGPSEKFAPPVSILKPIFGLDREAYENFASFCCQDYPNFEIIFCVSDQNEPSLPAIQKLIADFPRVPIRVLVGSDPIGASDKVNKLCRMAREARHDYLIVSDSDVRVDPEFLRAMMAPFAHREVGGVTCLYRGITDGSLSADLEALGNSADFAPSVIVAGISGSLNFMLGAVMITTKRHLAAIGGFESVADYFCDDYELGDRIAATGARVELSRLPVDIVYPHETLGDAFRHQVRWNLSIRYSRPLGHLGLILTQTLPWTILLWGFVSLPVALAYYAAAMLFRAALAISVGFRGMKDRLVLRRLWMLPLRDAFGSAAWFASFFRQRIHWRGRQFLIRRRRLVPISESLRN
jgi:ceramide glucosyltransferase